MSTALEFDRPVKRQLVHRASTAEVFPTDFQHHTRGEFVAGLQWPRGHGFYRLEPLDSALVVESIRQLTILTVHAGLGVPADLRLVMTALGFRIFGELSIEHGKAVEVAAGLSATRVRRTNTGELRSVRIEVELSCRDAPIAIGYGDAMVLTPSQYARIRGRHLGAIPRSVTQSTGPSPAQIGRLLPRDVTVQYGSRGLEAVADPTNPILFDHLVDHVPGAALIESCLQAVRLRTGSVDADFAEFDASFNRMVEFDAPNTLKVLNTDEWRIVIGQDGHRCVESTGLLRGA